MNASSDRLSVVDALRGVAALAVCWNHLTNGNDTFLPEGVLKASGSYGWLGIQMFFVISGFIIPYSLHRNQYRISDYGTFILKRIIRLDPPYLVGLLVVIALGYAASAAPGFRGEEFRPSFMQVLLHLGYVNVFFGYPWLNDIFWTLAIELQFYLLVGLMFPLLAHRSARVRIASFVALSALALLFRSDQFVFHWLFLFLLGMAAFQFKTNIIGLPPFVAWVIVLGSGAGYLYGPVPAMAGVATALLLSLRHATVRGPILFFGQISYSLYLLHGPIGLKLINLSQRIVHTMPAKVAVLMIALCASITAAWLLYRFVERPAQQWSSRIRYRSPRTSDSEMRPVSAA